MPTLRPIILRPITLRPTSVPGLFVQGRRPAAGPARPDHHKHLFHSLRQSWPRVRPVTIGSAPARPEGRSLRRLESW
ncbi:hypothetical protein JJ691_96790 [Kutzneria sp. CA-103260]|nr:hypothetical protein JJ691_96790 [Kutzneria sp. CA-103260]